MIKEFSFMTVGPENLVAVLAIMDEGPPIPVGVFEDIEDAEKACDRFAEAQWRKLH